MIFPKGERAVGDELPGERRLPNGSSVQATPSRTPATPKTGHDLSLGSGTHDSSPADGAHTSGGSSVGEGSNQKPRGLRRLWKALTGSPSRRVLSALGAVFTAVIAAIVSSLVAGWFTGSHSTSTAPQLIYFEPWTSNGISGEIHIASTANGTCGEQSDVSSRPDAFRCIEQNGVILDPCFTSPYVSNGIDVAAKNQVACPFPSPGSITVLRLSQPLPDTSQTGSADASRPWLIVLTNGESCRNSGPYGGITTAGGLEENYFCPNGGLFGYPQRNTA
jgi:hypothetical protein